MMTTIGPSVSLIRHIAAFEQRRPRWSVNGPGESFGSWPPAPSLSPGTGGYDKFGDPFLEPARHAMDVLNAIHSRRSIREFTDRPIGREEIERLLAAVIQAPNHRMTQPWRFYVLGPEARRAYGAVLGARKAKRIEDPEAARAVVEKVSAAEAAVPATIAVGMTLDANPEIREEDYAATLMGVQNLLLGAVAMGLGTHLKTGAVMDDPRARAAIGVPEGERIVALVQIGETAAEPEVRARRPVEDVTTWVS